MQFSGAHRFLDWRPAAVTLALMAVVFAADLMTPPDCVASGLYVVVILSAGRFLKGPGLVVVCAGCTALTLIAQVIDHNLMGDTGQQFDVSLFNGVVSLLVIWLAGYLLIRRASAETAVAEARSELARAGRAMTMSELAAAIAHEVAQPIAGAVANANACQRWLAGEPPNLDEARHAARRILRDARRAAEIVAQARAAVVRAPDQRRPINLNRLVRETIGLLAGEAARCDASIRLSLADEALTFVGRRIEIQQVIVNLVMNGLEATLARPPPRLLVVTTRRLDSGRAAAVTVADNGPGLPQEEVEIFKPFVTTKPQGAGMGLSISRNILEAHEGSLAASPNPGGGARFTFTLPLQDGG